MKYVSVNNIKNPYPVNEPEFINSAITKSDFIIADREKYVLSGKYPNNIADYPIINPENLVKFVPGTSFRFIIEFNPNNLYTSELYYNDLKKAYDENNPWFNVVNSPTVKLDFNFLQNYKNKNGFKIVEKYSEVEITDTLDTEEKMCRHIDWLVDKKAESVELREIDQLGNWRVVPDGSYGLGAKDEYESMLEGNPNSEDYGAEVVLEKYDITLPTLATVNVNQPSPLNLSPVEELVRIMGNIVTPPGKETYKPLGGGLGLALGLVAATVFTILTAGLGTVAIAGIVAGGAAAGKTLGDILGRNYSVEGKYWDYITKRATTRSLFESANRVIEDEKNADQAEWKQLLIETGKQMRVAYTTSDVQSAINVLLSIKATDNPKEMGEVRKGDLGYRIEVGNVVRFFRVTARNKFDVSITY